MRSELAAVGEFLRERSEIGLRLCEISGLKILSELLELRLNLLKAILRLLGYGVLKETAAGNSDDGHLKPPDLRAFLLRIAVASVVWSSIVK